MNMRLSNVRSVSAFVLVVTLAPLMAFAGDETKSESKPDKKERIAQLLAKPKLLFGDEFSARTLTASERREIGVYRYERETRQLHDTMLAELNLTDLQAKAIAKIIEDQLKYVRDTGGTPSRDWRPPIGTSADSPGGNRPTGPVANADRPAADRVRERRRPSPSFFDDPSEFLDLLATELSGDQAEKFETMSARWRRLRPVGFSDGVLRQLFRAVRDPDLKIDQDLRTKFEDRVREATVKLGRDRQFADKRLEAYEKAKADIVTTLPATQREHFEKTLRELQEEFAEEVLVIMDLRAKEKGKAETPAGASGEDDKNTKRTTD